MTNESQGKRIFCTGKVFADFIAIRMAPAPRPPTDNQTQATKPAPKKDKEK